AGRRVRDRPGRACRARRAVPGRRVTSAEGGRSLVVDEHLAPRLARGFVRWQLRRPSWILLLSVTAVVVALSVFLTATGSDGAAWVGVALVVLTSATVIVSWLAVRSSILRAYPVGDALLLKVGSWAGGVAVMPRALLSEDEVARLQAAARS
ncbi:hypothetical protein NH287_13475, partial [Microbacterium sp. CnD16-F]|uniref:hypothetical protein n=1 Tax=Microbacterium sp. CnD16-F TaxID=2954493 RepID=UPI00209784E6